MVHQLIATGEPSHIGNWNRIRRNRLIKAGVMEIDESAAMSSILPISLSDGVRYALGLDELGLEQ